MRGIMMNKHELYVVTGVSGRTGAATANTLLKLGKRLRVIVRDKAKGDIWAARGAEVAIADLTDCRALTQALSGAHAAYIVSPPQYSQDNLFEQAELMAKTIAKAISAAKVAKLVVLSSVGAEKAKGTGWITMNHTLERYLTDKATAVAFLRAAYFIENWYPLAQIASQQEELASFLAPLERELPMIATQDIGRIAAEMLCEDWQGTKVVALEGPQSYSPNDVATQLTQVVGTTIKPVNLPESTWLQSMQGQNFSDTAIAGFIEMTKGLNSGYISFNDKSIEHRQGVIPLEAVLQSMNLQS